MVKSLISLFFIVSLIHASAFQEKISSYMGKNEYKKQKNLVNIIFKNKSKYSNNNNEIDSIKILETLKENGLLKLLFDKAKTFELTFKSNNPLISMRIINESLERLGYSYYLSKKIDKKQNEIEWTISLMTQHLIDPTLLAHELMKKGCKILDISRNSTSKWMYQLHLEDNINIISKNIELDTTISLGKPIKEYWVNTQNAYRISLSAHPADHWYPKITFFDKNLNMLKEIHLKENRTKLKTLIPENSKYVKISDNYTLENIKRGLSIYLKSDR